VNAGSKLNHIVRTCHRERCRDRLEQLERLHPVAIFLTLRDKRIRLILRARDERVRYEFLPNRLRKLILFLIKLCMFTAISIKT
jgi:hypothetical protein